MADDEQSTSGVVPGLVQEFIDQFRAATQRLETSADPVAASRRPPAHLRCLAAFRRSR